MKRILQVVSCLELGGTEAFIMNNYRRLDKEKYQFDFLVFIQRDYPYLPEIKSLGGRVFFCGLPAMNRYHEFEKTVIDTIKKNGPYIAVHSHVNMQNGLVLKAAKKAGVKKRISHSHDTSGKGARGVNKIVEKYKEYLIKRNTTHYLACSADAGKYLYGDVFFKERGRVIPNGIDLTSFISKSQDKACLCQEFNIAEDTYPVVGNITRFEAKKNPKFVVTVFKELLKEYPKAILLLGGPDGGQLQEVKQLVDKLGISSSVRFIGKRTDIAECLKLIDIYLFPSVFEGLGIAFLEAQASGCFCVASTAVSAEATVIDGSVLRLKLEDGSEYWSEKIVDRFQIWKKPDVNYRIACFRDKGFEIESSHINLLEVYNE